MLCCMFIIIFAGEKLTIYRSRPQPLLLTVTAKMQNVVHVIMQVELAKSYNCVCMTIIKDKTYQQSSRSPVSPFNGDYLQEKQKLPRPDILAFNCMKTWKSWYRESKCMRSYLCNSYCILEVQLDCWWLLHACTRACTISSTSMKTSITQRPHESFKVNKISVESIITYLLTSS